MNYEELRQHALSAAYPPATDLDYAALVNDIEKYGQRDSIVMYAGQVLDGWHRYQACAELGIPVLKRELPLSDDPAAFVESVNGHRRHLTASQRAAATLVVDAWRKASATVAPGLSATVAPKNTKAETAKLAKEAKVSPRTMAYAQAAEQAGLGDKVRSGALTAEQAAAAATGAAPRKAKKVGATVAPQDSAEVIELRQQLDALTDTQTELLAENESMSKVFDADDKLAAAMAEIKKLKAYVVVLESRNRGLLNEKNEAIKAAKSWQRKAEKASKAAAS